MGAASSAFRQSFFLSAPGFTERELGDLEGKVVILTGGYTGIGLALAHILYAANCTLYIAGRSHSKATNAITALRSAHPRSKARVEFLHCDLADLASIKPAVDAFLRKEERLDVLLNNAGVMWPPAGSLSAQGHDLQIGTNVYGPFLLTHLLRPILASTAGKSDEGSVRVCWAGSIAVDVAAPPGAVLFAAGEGGTEVVRGEGEGLDRVMVYGETKCANVMLGVEGARRWGGEGVVHTSFNPGNLRSELQRHASWYQRWALAGLCYPVEMGAYTELFAAFSPTITPHQNGCYIHPWGTLAPHNAPMQKALQRKADGGDGTAEKLWEVCWEVCRPYMS